MLALVTINNVIFTALAVVGLFIFKALRIFFFPRKLGIPESYPLQNTILLMNSQHIILDMCVEFCFSEHKRSKKKTFVLEVLGLPPMVMTNDVANVTHVLKTNFENYGKDAPIFKPKLQGLLGDGIFNADGQQWFAHRKTSAHLFKLSEFKTTVLNIFNHDLSIVIKYIKAKKHDSFDLHSLMHKFTLESISQIAFGLELGCISDNEVEFANDFDFCTSCINDSLINPFWLFERYCTPSGWKYFAALRRLNRFSTNVIKERRAQVAAGDETCRMRNDLLTLYLNRDNFARPVNDNDDDEGGGKKGDGLSDAYMEPTDKNLKDVILNMIIAGRDTTAQALSWTFYRLCIHPEVQVKVREEVRLLASKLESEGKPATDAEGGYPYSFLQQLRYTEAVCMEALRLHPSVPKEAKCVMKDDVLPDGTQVRKGDLLSFQAYTMGRDPDLWGENCMEFVPERFLTANKPNPFVFTAFQVSVK